jgi:hypothetical protein
VIVLKNKSMENFVDRYRPVQSFDNYVSPVYVIDLASGIAKENELRVFPQGSSGEGDA